MPLGLATLVSLCLLGWSAWLSALEPETAKTEIRAYPSNSRVEIGDQKVKVSHPDFQPAEREMSPEEKLLVEILKPKAATVTLKVDGPSNYTVSSGDDKWKTPKSLELAAGSYLLKVEAEGFIPNGKLVEVQAGHEKEVEIKLKAIPKIPSLTPPPRATPRVAPRPRPRPVYRPRPTWRPARPTFRPTPVPRPSAVPAPPRPRFTPVPR